MVTTKLMTAEELEQMPDDRPGRYDLIDGELIRMPPPGEEHGDRVVNILARSASTRGHTGSVVSTPTPAS